MIKYVYLIKDEVKVLSERVSGMNKVTDELRNKVSDPEEENKKLSGEIGLRKQEHDELEEGLDDGELKLRSLEEKNNDLEEYTSSVTVFALMV